VKVTIEFKNGRVEVFEDAELSFDNCGGVGVMLADGSDKWWNERDVFSTTSMPGHSNRAIEKFNDAMAEDGF